MQTYEVSLNAIKSFANDLTYQILIGITLFCISICFILKYDNVKVKKNLPGKKIKSIEVLVKIENNN